MTRQPMLGFCLFAGCPVGSDFGNQKVAKVVKTDLHVDIERLFSNFSGDKRGVGKNTDAPGIDPKRCRLFVDFRLDILEDLLGQGEIVLGCGNKYQVASCVLERWDGVAKWIDCGHGDSNSVVA